MSDPKRIQQRRAKGWRMPEGARSVARPGGWGNPFKVGETKVLRGDDDSRVVCNVTDRATAVAYFRWFIEHDPNRVAKVRDELAGMDLACWCPLDQPCHADVLLEVANR